MDADIKKLQGTWNVVALEVEGQRMDAVIFTCSKIVIKGDKFTTISMGATYEGKVTVDAEKSPKNFDLKFSKGTEKGNTSYGIYKLDKDTWKICLTITAKNRPKKFATAPGSGLGLETLHREKKPKKQPASAKATQKTTKLAASSGTVTALEGEWKMVSCISDGYPIEKSMIKMGRR